MGGTVDVGIVTHTVDGRKNVRSTEETVAETIVCWYLQGNRIIPGGFLRWCRISSIHSMFMDPEGWGGGTGLIPG